MKFKGQTVAVLCTVLGGAALSALLAWYHADLLRAAGCLNDGVLALTNNDGYFHLHTARMFATTGVPASWAQTGSLLLARVVAFLGGGNTSHLLTVGVLAGPVIGFSMLLAILPWAWETKSPLCIFFTPLLTLFSPYWLDRTHLGVLDTDALVPFLLYAALYAVMRFSTSSSKRWAWVLGYLVALGFTWLWWKPGVFLALGFIGCYLIYCPRQRFDLIIKIALVVLGILALILVMLGISPFYQWSNYIVAHLKLAFGGAEGALLSSAISELRGLTLVELGVKALGTAWLLPLALLGGILYGYRFRWKSLFLLLSAVAFGMAALLSRRFIPFFSPAAALFAVYFSIEACRWAGSKLEKQRHRRQICQTGLMVAAGVLLLSGVGTNAVRYVPKPYFAASDFDLAHRLKQEFPSGTTIWTWWDYGYFFSFLTDMPVYFDGGSQTDVSCFTAAYPLMQGDLSIAAQWIRYFSRHRQASFDLSHRGQGWSAYLAHYIAGHVQTQTDDAQSVALCLPERIYTTVGFLYSFAHMFDEHPPAVSNRLDLFAKEGFHYDRAAQTVSVPEAMIQKGYTGFGSVLDVTDKIPEQFDFKALPDPYLIYSGNTSFLAVTDSHVVGSVLFRLLGLFAGAPTLFEPVQFDYRTGGIWRVHAPGIGG